MGSAARDHASRSHEGLQETLRSRQSGLRSQARTRPARARLGRSLWCAEYLPTHPSIGAAAGCRRDHPPTTLRAVRVWRMRSRPSGCVFRGPQGPVHAKRVDREGAHASAQSIAARNTFPLPPFLAHQTWIPRSAARPAELGRDHGLSPDAESREWETTQGPSKRCSTSLDRRARRPRPRITASERAREVEREVSSAPSGESQTELL
jgi:hypothetical protein